MCLLLTPFLSHVQMYMCAVCIHFAYMQHAVTKGSDLCTIRKVVVSKCMHSDGKVTT